MKVEKIVMDDALLLKPKIFGDERGYFFESYNEKILESIGLKEKFVQDNQSMSHKGVIRGMHFQMPPNTQGKLVRVTRGAVFDAIVDLRKGSKFFGKSYGIELSAENAHMLWVPPGFAHGFQTLLDNTIFQYKCTNYYNKESEKSIRWDDPFLEIEWPISAPAVLSQKDKDGFFFYEFDSPF